jgi:hypothetical protein
LTLKETLQRIEERLERLEDEINQMRRQMLENLRVDRKLLSLPDHLRKTARGLLSIGEGSASDVCRFTNRTRAIESTYLNQLERQGLVKSFRRGRQKIFLPEELLKNTE